MGQSIVRECVWDREAEEESARNRNIERKSEEDIVREKEIQRYLETKRDEI